MQHAVTDASREGPSDGPVRLSVVIPVHNGADTLGEQLDALASQACRASWEVVVVDDASSDASVEVASSFRSRIPLRVIELDTRGGAGRARNVGAAAARGAYLAFVDADDVVAEGWLDAAVRALDVHVAAASRFEDEALNTPRARELRHIHQREGLQEYTNPPFLPHAGGCGLMVRREVHARLSGFDESLPCLEDTDYTWRLQLAGEHLHFEPSALVHVRYRSSTLAAFWQRYRYGYYNVVLYVRYRAYGMPDIDRRAGVRGWIRLADPRKLVRLVRSDARAKWTRDLGWRLGRLAASVRYGVWAL